MPTLEETRNKQTGRARTGLISIGNTRDVTAQDRARFEEVRAFFAQHASVGTLRLADRQTLQNFIVVALPSDDTFALPSTLMQKLDEQFPGVVIRQREMHVPTAVQADAARPRTRSASPERRPAAPPRMPASRALSDLAEASLDLAVALCLLYSGLRPLLNPASLL